MSAADRWRPNYLSPQGLLLTVIMMAVVRAASASFTRPISHPANTLVMGPGGYRFSDYIKLGVPRTLVIFVAVMLCCRSSGR